MTTPVSVAREVSLPKDKLGWIGIAMIFTGLLTAGLITLVVLFPPSNSTGMISGYAQSFFGAFMMCLGWFIRDKQDPS